MTIDEAKELIRKTRYGPYDFEFDQNVKEFPGWYALRAWPYAPDHPKKDWYSFPFYVNKKTGQVFRIDSPITEAEFKTIEDPDQYPVIPRPQA